MKSFRVRLMLGFGAVLAAALTGFGLLASMLTAQGINSDLDDLLKTKLFIAKQIGDFRKQGSLAALEQALDVDRGGFFIQIFDSEGVPVARSAKLIDPLPLSESTRRAAAERSDVILEDRIDSKGAPLRMATGTRYEMFDRSRPLLGYVQVGIPLAARDARLRTLHRWMWTIGPLVVLAAMTLVWLQADRWLAALTAVEDTARRISAETLSKQRVFVSPGDAELARLAESFNSLLDRLESAYGTQQRFVADASHELRTPLTVLRGEIEVALRRTRSLEEYQDVLQSNREEIERLSRLVENLLTLASADAGEGLANRETIDLSSLATEVVDTLKPVADARKITTGIVCEGTVEIEGDRYALGRVIANLVENGIRYSPAGESVTVRVSMADSCGVVEVSDTGPGIAPEHLPHLFERFYRVDKARSRELGGAGLGLSIVKSIVEAHGGTVSVRSQLGHGTAFTVRLPLVAPIA